MALGVGELLNVETTDHLPYTIWEEPYLFTELSLRKAWYPHGVSIIQHGNLSVSRFPTEVHLISWHLNAISSSWVGLYLLPGRHSRGGWEKNRGLEIEREQPAYLLQSVAILPFHHTLWEPLLTGCCVWPLPWISL